MSRKMFRYVSLPGKSSPDLFALAWHNRAFEFWLRSWTEVLRVQDGSQPDVDDFLRQDRLTLIYQETGDDCPESRIVAFHAYTFFDLRQAAARCHSYFKRYYSDRAMAELSRRGLHRLMTMEYFSVAPELRGRRPGPSLVGAVVSLGLRVFEDVGADAIVSVARADIGVARMAYRFGAIPLDQNLNFHNTSCDLIAILQGEQKPHDDSETRALAEELWSHKSAW
jgi:hypothetical protein